MTPIYTYSALRSLINSGIKGKIAVLANERDTINRIIREVVGDIDLNSAKRKTALTPNLFNGSFEYAAPTDLKSNAVISIINQKGKPQLKYSLTTAEEFRQRMDSTRIAIEDADLIKKILVNAPVDDKSITVSSLDAITAGGGTWVVSSSGAENLEVDTDDFIGEGGSLKFDISSTAAQTTAGIKNETLNLFDLTEYLNGNGVAIVYAYINSATGITNFILKIGTDTSNYYQKTVTAVSDGTAFKAGWNILKFDLTSLSTVGTPTDSSCRYAELYMTKADTKVSELGYRFDSLVLKRGEKNSVSYYSKYGWQNSSGTYIENSTQDSDLLNADTDEFELFVEKGIEIAGADVDEMDASSKAASNYLKKKQNYESKNPSQRLTIISTYADFISTE